MMSDVEWNNESVLRLIEEYKKRRELWDKRDDLYRAQTAKYDAWASMARVFHCDIADLRKKLQSIFASYRREKCKVRGGGRSTWCFYPHLSFLHNHIEQPEIAARRHDRAGRAQSSDEQDADDGDYDDDHVETIIIKEEPVSEYVQAKELPPLKTCRRLKRTLKRRIIDTSKRFKDAPVAPTGHSSQIDGKLIEVLRLLRKSSEISKKNDECDSFGEYIALSLRKHDERTQSMIKQAINNILFEQEMKKYSAGQYVDVADDNPLVIGDE